MPHLTTVAHEALRGAAALVVRQLFVQGANFAGALALARLLSPAEFGLFAIAAFAMNALLQLAGSGLAASLVRQPEEPSLEEYRAVFTVQQLVVVTVAAALWIAAPAVARLYALPAADVWIFRLVAIALVCASWQVVPTARLERRLAFAVVARVEIGQAFVYNVVAVALAWRGLGAVSVALALLARAAAGAVLVHLASPWPIGWRWDWARAREHVRFGLPVQGIALVSVVKDSITPILLGVTGGAAAVGYVGWAQLVATYPTWAVMVMQRVYLPAFARVQDEPQELGPFVEQVVRLSNAAVAPLATLTFLLIEPITTVVFGAQWLPALPVFRLLWIANVLVPTATPLLALLNARGRSRLAFSFAVAWMAATWALGAPLIAVFGALGFALANVCVQAINLVLVRVAQREASFRVLAVIAPVWTWSAVVALVGVIVHTLAPGPAAARLGAAFVAALMLYVLGLMAAAPADARQGWTWLRTR